MSPSNEDILEQFGAYLFILESVSECLGRQGMKKARVRTI